MASMTAAASSLMGPAAPVEARKNPNIAGDERGAVAEGLGAQQEEQDEAEEGDERRR